MTILALLLLAALVVVVLTNLLAGTQAGSVSLVFRSYAQVPLGYVIALSALSGATITWLAGISKHVSRFWRIRRLESEIASLRSAPASPPAPAQSPSALQDRR